MSEAAAPIVNSPLFIAAGILQNCGAGSVAGNMARERGDGACRKSANFNSALGDKINSPILKEMLQPKGSGT
jgi:hypothetical protein